MQKLYMKVTLNTCARGQTHRYKIVQCLAWRRVDEQNHGVIRENSWTEAKNEDCARCGYTSQ